MVYHQKHLMKNIKLQIYNTFDGELENLWLEFQARNSCYLFQTYQWLKYWFTTVGEPSLSIKLFVIIVTEGNNVVAIFPFGIRTSCSIKILEFIGGGQCDYNEPLISHNVSEVEYVGIWKQVLDKVKANDVYEFQRIPYRRDKCFLSNLINVEKIGISYSLEFSKETDISSYISKRLLKDNARMVRRLSEKGDLKYVIVNNEQQFSSIVDVCINQKMDRYNTTGARNIFLDENIMNFYKKLFEGIECNGDVCVHLSALMLDDEVLATHLGAIYGDKFYYLIPTFSSGKYDKYSPGRLLLEYLVSWSINNNLKVFDFTVGAESYKNKWCNQEMPIYSHLSSNSIKGFLYVCVIKIILWGKGNKYTRALAMKFNRMFKSFNLIIKR